MNTFIIDHDTHNVNLTIRALGKLKTTKACQFNGVYCNEPESCQIYVETEMTESGLDDWLWRSKIVGDYIGVVTTENRDEIGVLVK